MTGGRAARFGDLMALAMTAAVAGVGDAYTLTHYGVFTANQSGNLVHLGMAVAGRFADWPQAAGSVLGFGLGGLFGTVLHRRAQRLHQPAPVWQLGATVVIVGAAVGLAVLSGTDGRSQVRPVVLAFLLAIAMGILAVMITRTAGVTTTTTYQTGTVLRTASAALDWMSPVAPHREARRRWFLGILGIGCYVLGSASGALLADHPAAVLVVFGAYAALMLVCVGRRRAIDPVERDRN